MKSRCTARAAVNKGALITLAVVAVVAAIFWAVRSTGPSGPSGSSNDSQTTMLQCKECKHAYPISLGEWKKVPLGDKGAAQCPKCQKWGVFATRMSPEDFAETNKGAEKKP